MTRSICGPGYMFGSRSTYRHTYDPNILVAASFLDFSLQFLPPSLNTSVAVVTAIAKWLAVTVRQTIRVLLLLL